MRKMSSIIAAIALSLTLAAAAFAADAAKLTYVYWGSPAEDQAIRKALKEFEAANPGITVTPLYLPGDMDGSTYNAKMKSMAASGSLPDVGYFRPEEFGNYATNDYFLDLTPYMTKDNMKADYLAQTWLSIGGKVYGAYTAAEAQVMWYSKKALKDAGIAPPPTDYTKAWTWDQFTANLKKLTVDKAGKHPGDTGFDPAKIAKYGVVYDLWSAMYYPTLWSNGGGVFSDDGKDVLIDKPESIQAFQRLADLINKDHTMPYMGGGSGLPAPSVMLATGQLAFWVTGQWTLLDLGKMKNLDLGVAALPIQKKPAQIYLSGVNVVFKATKSPDAAWKLQKWMMTPDKTLDLYTSGLWMPTKSSFYSNAADLAKWTKNDVHPAGYKEAILDSMKVSINEPIKIKNNVQIWGDFINPALESIWTGQATAMDALTDAAKQIRASGLLQGTF